MGGWAALGAITREAVWGKFLEAAQINGHLVQDPTDLERSFDRGFRTGYLQAFADGHVEHTPIGTLNNSPPLGFSEVFSPSLEAMPLGVNGACAPSNLSVLQVDELLSTSAPQRKWRAHPFVPQAEVTLLAGDGGGGKSTICLQLVMACVGEKGWFGFTVEPCNVLYVSAEDPKDELHYRLEQINRHMQLQSDKLARFKIIDLSGADATTLASFSNKGEISRTPLLKEIERIAAQHNAGLIILDAAADFFGGNENERREVRAFIGLLRGLAIRLDTAIMLIAHPSVDGMRSGRGYSGSTHWNNSVRSRLTFTDEESNELIPGLEVKVLELAKSNRARRGEKIRMMWNDGQFILPGISVKPNDGEAKEVFLQLLKKTAKRGDTGSSDTGQELRASGDGGKGRRERYWQAQIETGDECSARRGDNRGRYGSDRAPVKAPPVFDSQGKPQPEQCPAWSLTDWAQAEGAPSRRPPIARGYGG
jgi:archaellum biogenesis ATPase FlaH